MNAKQSSLVLGSVPERRPIITRDWQVSKLIANWLVQKGISPNTISLAGMAAGIAAGCALPLTGHTGFVRAGFIAAILGIVIRGMGNVLDGMVAVQGGRACPIGELFNEVPDRVADVVILIGAGYARGSVVLLGYLAALAAVLTAYVRAQGRALGAPQEFCGPMAKPQRMLMILGLALFCAVLPTSWQPSIDVAGLKLGAFGLGLIVITVGGFWTCWRRLRRIARRLSKTYPAGV
jgi:phosphatidylglycerophosphate synthase